MARNRYFEDEQLVEKFSGKMLLRLLSYTKPYARAFVTTGIFMLIISVITMLPPYFNSIIIDKIIGENRVPEYVELAIGIMCVWAAVIVCEIVFNLIRSRVMSRTAFSVVRDLRRDMFSHLQRLSFDYYDTRPAGKVLVRVTSYVDELANILSNTVIGVVVDSIKTIVILGFLYALDYRFALVITICIIPLGLSMLILRTFIHKRYQAHRNKASNRTAYIAENINGLAVTRAFNRTDSHCATYDDLNAQCNKSWRRVIRINEMFFPCVDFFWYLGQAMLYAAAFFFIVNYGTESVSAGKLVAFVGYLAMFSAPLNNMSAYVQQLSVASSNLERVFELMDTPVSIADREGAYDLPPIVGNVTYNNVTFGYEKGVNILENFNLDVPAGKTIALVGPTGAGKTTVVNLLSRFYDIKGGNILIDGHDISGVKLYSLRRQVGVMMQDSFLFSGTVMENIRYARPDATDEECIEASKQAHCHEFIMKFPEGYNHVFGEKGAGLSGGQIQLLSFARTILCDPKILILDEATSAIDTETELQIQQIMGGLLKGRTSFIIAHRLSTIRKADCILYIADKGIAEAGTHTQLMAKKGLYYKLNMHKL